MKVTLLGLLAVIATANAGVAWPHATELVRTPSLDSAIVQSQRLNGAFSYSTVERHAYAPVVSLRSENDARTCFKCNSVPFRSVKFNIIHSSLKFNKFTIQDLHQLNSQSIPSIPATIHL